MSPGQVEGRELGTHQTKTHDLLVDPRKVGDELAVGVVEKTIPVPRTNAYDFLDSPQLTGRRRRGYQNSIPFKLHLIPYPEMF
jgi:hypothetical protein